jgi:ring-1,2-phenylacetyl-CoA epoxidase subunit PaaD
MNHQLYALEDQKEKILTLLKDVMDPEIPVLSVRDLGIVRDVIVEGQEVEVVITPTYSGCPAMDVIPGLIRLRLLEAGYGACRIRTELSPAWTTDWISSEGRDKLKAYGIAPPNPVPVVCDVHAFQEDEAVQCPHCRSYRTQRISEFGSTPCKALWKCNDCLEPFEYFKCH